uniref:hypothetical protein n=1 Tax=Pseudomonas aeruginosa TaxID=287 RepID=UPI002B40728B
MDRILTEQEFQNWKENPATRAILEYLSRCQEVLRYQWATGMLSDESPGRQKAAMDSALAEHVTLQRLIQLDYEQYKEVMHNDD